MNKKLAWVMMLLLIISIGSVYAETTETSEEEAARVLNEMNILKGDGKSFNLSGELTRAEGATFIVRLLGMEQEVIKNKIDYVALSFSDVFGTDWYSPYVGYCVDKGIINGYSDGTFRAQEKLSEQAFVKMVLGAMGYEYGKDFSWSETFSFAYGKGVLTNVEYKDMVSNTRAYSRGKVVQLLHHVMKQKKADNSLMIDVLVKANLLTREKAIEYKFITDSVMMKVESLKQNKGPTFTLLFNEVPEEFTSNQVVIKEKYSDTTLETTKIVVSDVSRGFYITVDEQVPDKEYVMTLTGVKDLEGNVLADYTYEFYGYRLSSYNSAYFRIAKAELSAINVLDITFTHPVDINKIKASDISIMRAGNPFLVGNDTTMALEVDGSNPYLLHVEFTSFNFTFADNFECVVSKDARSLYGAYVKDGLGDSARFTSVASEVEAFDLVQTTLESEKSLILTFNKNINETIAEQVFSYYITTNKNVPLQIAKAEVIKSGNQANKSVRLTTELSISEGSSYSLLINQAYDTARNESIIEKKIEFLAKSIVKPTLVIKSAKTTDGNRVEVVLSDYLDPVEAIKVDHYSIKDATTGFYVAKPSKVYYDFYLNEPTLVLEFNNKLVFTDGHSYTLTIDEKMKANNGFMLAADSVKTFVDQKSTYTTHVLKEVMYIGNNIILIKGNKELSLEVPNVINSNYVLTYTDNDITKILEPIGVTYFSEHVILLRFEEINKDMAYMLKATKIITEFGETINTSAKPLSVKIEALN